MEAVLIISWVEPVIDYLVDNLFRAPSRDQTSDLLITSQLLYQLSYGGVFSFSWCKSSVFENTTLLFFKKIYNASRTIFNCCFKSTSCFFAIAIFFSNSARTFSPFFERPKNSILFCQMVKSFSI